MVVGSHNNKQYSHAESFENPFYFILYAYSVVCVPLKPQYSKRNNQHTLLCIICSVKWHLIDGTKGIFDICRHFKHSQVTWPPIDRINCSACARIKPFQFLINCFSVLHHYFAPTLNISTVWCECVCVSFQVCLAIVYTSTAAAAHNEHIYSGQCGVH